MMLSPLDGVSLEMHIFVINEEKGKKGVSSSRRGKPRENRSN